MIVPGHVENWIVILDQNGAGLFDTSFSTLSKINDILSINYTSTLHKMFILNPSFLFYQSWRLLESISPF
jgi:CRAL/TRIO domain